MAEKLSIGLKKKGGEESHDEGKRPDIELTEEDLKQISGGTTKAVQIRPESIK
jgi:bacteriocin-like protein